MMTQPHQQPDREKFALIAQKFAPQARLRRIWPLTGGLSAEMTGLELELPGGEEQKIVVRRFGQAHTGPGLHPAAKEFRLLQITHAAALPTPRPYFLDTSGQILPTPYLVIEFVDGEMCLAPTDVTQHVTQMATHLAQIHTLHSPEVDLSFLEENDLVCPELRREPLPEVGSIWDEAQIRAVLARRQLLPTRPAVPSLLHGDFWPGNSLWRAGQLVAVIDWEDAALGDPLLDLARSRSEIAWIFGLEAMHQFTAHYQTLVPWDDADLPYWDLCAALCLWRLLGEDVGVAAAYFIPFGRTDITPQTIQADLTAFVNQALSAITGL